MALLWEASIFSTFAQGVLYGFSLLLFIMTTWFLLQNSHKHRISYAMLVASCALMLMSTAEMAVNIARIYQGVVSVGPTLAGGPDEYFGDNSRLSFIIKSCLWSAQSLVLDGVVIYRTYVVWQSFLVIIIPVLGWCGILVVAIVTNAVRTNHAGEFFALETGPWITSLYALELGTNFLATSLLAYKIHLVMRKTSHGHSGSGLSPFLRVVIESGALYSATIFVGMILFIVRSNGAYVMLDLTAPIISIVFNMIFVRLGLERRSVATQRSNSSFVVVLAPGQSPEDLPGAKRRTSAPAEDLEVGDVTLKITEMYLADDESSRSGDMPRVDSTDGNDVKEPGRLVCCFRGSDAKASCRRGSMEES